MIDNTTPVFRFLLFTLLCAVFISGCDRGQVYICDTETAYAYHKADYCRGLENCSEAEPILVTEGKARDMNRKPCGYCYPDNYGERSYYTSNIISEGFSFLFLSVLYFVCNKLAIKVTRKWITKNPKVSHYRLLIEFIIFICFIAVVHFYANTRQTRGDEDSIDEVDDAYVLNPHYSLNVIV